jgi:hypothetical protein
MDGGERRWRNIRGWLSSWFSSFWVVGAWWSYKSRKYFRFLYSPEGQRQKAQEIQESIAAIIADAQEGRPKLKPNELDRSIFDGFPPSEVMAAARYLAKNAAKDELQKRGIKLHSVEASEITKIGNALLEVDLLSFIENAKVDLEKSNYRRRRGSPH